MNNINKTMKTIIAILLTATSCWSAEFSASSFFQTPVSLHDQEVKPSGGINLRGIFWNGIGADVDLIQSATRDTFLDRGALHLVYKYSVWKVPKEEKEGETVVQFKDFSLLGLGGYGYDFEDRQHGIEFGGGAEYTYGSVVLGIGVRMQRDEADDYIAVPQVSAGWRF